MEDATKQDREHLERELARVLRTANESDDYASITAPTDNAVARCDGRIQAMLAKEVSFRALIQPLACAL